MSDESEVPECQRTISNFNSRSFCFSFLRKSVVTYKFLMIIVQTLATIIKDK